MEKEKGCRPAHVHTWQAEAILAEWLGELKQLQGSVKRGPRALVHTRLPSASRGGPCFSSCPLLPGLVLRVTLPSSVPASAGFGDFFPSHHGGGVSSAPKARLLLCSLGPSVEQLLGLVPAALHSKY